MKIRKRTLQEAQTGQTIEALGQDFQCSKLTVLAMLPRLSRFIGGDVLKFKLSYSKFDQS